MLVSCVGSSSDLKIEATDSPVVAAATPSPEAAELDDQIVKTTEPEPNKSSTDGDMAALTPTMQHVITAVRRADMDNDSRHEKVRACLRCTCSTLCIALQVRPLFSTREGTR